MEVANKILFFAYGNPSRGDDALGPELLERLDKDEFSHVEFLNDMQLQVEHIDDLLGKEIVVFIDADSSCQHPYYFSTIYPEKDSSYTSHAMTPSALLFAFQQVYQQQLPLIFLLRIRGYQFELGTDISEQAQDNLSQSLLLMQKLFTASLPTP